MNNMHAILPPYGMPAAGGPSQLPPPGPPRPGFGSPIEPGAEQPEFPFVIPTCEEMTEAKIENGILSLEKGGYAAIEGAILADKAENVKISCDKPCVKGFEISGDSCYAIKDSEIILNGDGLNDFAGTGAGVQVRDNAAVTLDNVKITTNGVIRPCTFAGDSTTMIFTNCELTGNGGYLPEDFPETVGPGMKQPPRPLGIDGNCRTHLSVGNSHTYFYDSKIVADGWAALSSDAAFGDLYLEANRCEITVRKPGYGIYSDGGCNVVLNDCKVDTASHTIIMAGRCKGRINNSIAESGRYCAMIHTVFGHVSEIAELTVQYSDIKTGDDCIWVKSANAYIDIRGCTMVSDKGCIIHSTVNDDPCATRVEPGEQVYGIKAALSDMEITGDIIHEDPDRTMSVLLSHSKLVGAVRKAYLQLDAASCWKATGNSEVLLVGAIAEGQIDAGADVRIDGVSVDGKVKSGEYKLASGGILFVRT
ncbi:MAG: right-handed parallel beta-helix repeat-containing protein [Clostridiales bacterium]|nr:right-handed parallel beta-helix repeat-containing protein [Clostridiales bacterium]